MRKYLQLHPDTAHDPNSDTPYLQFLSSIFAGWQERSIPVISTNGEVSFLSEDVVTTSTEQLVNLFVKPEGKEFVVGSVLLTTSGSTGVPKQIFLSGRNLCESFLTGERLLHLSSQDHWTLLLPPYHIGGLMVFVRALLSGSMLSIAEPGMMTPVEAVKKYDPTHISVVSPFLQQFVEKHIPSNPSHRCALAGGGKMDQQLIKSASELGWKVWTSYGATETAAFIAALPPEMSEAKPGSVGRLIPPIYGTVVDTDTKEPVGIGTEGELLVEAPQIYEAHTVIGQGTLQLTPRTHPHATGDTAIIDADGYLYITGRTDDIIKSGGKKISLSKIEAVLRSHQSVKDVAVVGMDDPYWGETPVVVMVCTPEQNADDLKRYLQTDLAPFEIPKRFHIVSEIPKTSLGKTDRRKVKALLSESDSLLSFTKNMATPMQSEMLELTKRLLALTESGLFYAKNDYETERYTELKEISFKMMALLTDADVQKIGDIFSKEWGYQTPKVDVRSVVIRDNKLLMVKEKVDGLWAMPGGWADVGYHASSVAEKEVLEESGVVAKPERLLAVFDNRFHNHPPSPFHIYKHFMLCTYVSGEPHPGSETLDAGFFPFDALPPLSVGRNTQEEIDTLIRLALDPPAPALFD